VDVIAYSAINLRIQQAAQKAITCWNGVITAGTESLQLSYQADRASRLFNTSQV